MPRKRFTSEQIISKLREAEVALAKGKSMPLVCKQIGVTEQTYYRWRKEYGGLKIDQAKKLRELEKENARLKKLVANRMISSTRTWLWITTSSERPPRETSEPGKA